MLKTRYLLILLLLVAAWSAVLTLWLSQGQNPFTSDKKINAQRALMENSLEAHWEELHYLESYLLEQHSHMLLTDLVFVPTYLHGVMDSLHKFQNELQDQSLVETSHRAEKLSLHLETALVELLDKHSEVFNLRFEYLEASKARITKQRPDYTAIMSSALFSTARRDSLEKHKIFATALLHGRFLALDLISRFASRPFTTTQFYPVISVNQVGLAMGDTTHAAISVGKFGSILQPQHVSFVVNGDTIAMKEDGIARYQVVGKKRGEAQIDCELIVTDALTGEVTSTINYSNYYVY